MFRVGIPKQDSDCKYLMMYLIVHHRHLNENLSLPLSQHMLTFLVLCKPYLSTAGAHLNVKDCVVSAGSEALCTGSLHHLQHVHIELSTSHLVAAFERLWNL